MTPAARMQAAIDLLDRWQTGTPVEQALTQWARGSRFAGSKDRRAVRDIVYSVLRRKGQCAVLGGGQSGRHLVLGHLFLEGLDPAQIFTGARYAPDALTPSEAAPAGQPKVLDDLPDWLHAPLAKALGADLVPVIARLTERAPVWLRVNTRAATRAEAEARLFADDIRTVPDRRCDTALLVTENAPKLAQSRAYAEGLVELQDLSVQMACAMIDWPKGRLLDLCAGGGGKALAIAAATGGAVDVHDANPERMRDLPVRAARAGAQLQVVETPQGAYALVLCDVPCSGSGTWRRDPEAKWRLTEERLDQLGQIQAQILRDGAALVGPGGRLVYMTCSMLAQENDAQVAAFLAAHPGWRLRQSCLITPLAGSDGFFVAELARDGA